MVGVKPEYSSVIELAKDALISARAKGEYDLNVPTHMKNAVIAAIDAHDQQIQSCTVAQFQDALENTFAELQAM